MFRLFQIAFWVGVLFTFATFILGQLFDLGDFDGDIDFESDFDFDADVPGYAISPLKPIVITSFVTVFGGVGLILLNRGMESPIAAFIAVAAATTVSWLLYNLVVVPLHKAQNTSAISQAALIGREAKATLNMSKDSFGNIVYAVGGNTYSSPAKTLEEEIIHKGEEVIIKKIEKNIFYVVKKQQD